MILTLKMLDDLVAVPYQANEKPNGIDDRTKRDAELAEMPIGERVRQLEEDLESHVTSIAVYSLIPSDERSEEESEIIGYMAAALFREWLDRRQPKGHGPWVWNDREKWLTSIVPLFANADRVVIDEYSRLVEGRPEFKGPTTIDRVDALVADEPSESLVAIVKNYRVERDAEIAKMDTVEERIKALEGDVNEHYVRYARSTAVIEASVQTREEIRPELDEVEVAGELASVVAGHWLFTRMRPSYGGPSRIDLDKYEAWLKKMVVRFAAADRRTWAAVTERGKLMD